MDREWEPGFTRHDAANLYAMAQTWLHADISATFVNAGDAFIDRLVDGTAKHAVRRAHEMRDAEAMLRELGTPTTMATATAESLERIANVATHA